MQTFNVKQERIRKKKYLSQECQQMEEFNKKKKMRDLSKKITGITGKQVAKVGLFNYNHNRDLMEANEIKGRWKNHIKTFQR